MSVISKLWSLATGAHSLDGRRGLNSHPQPTSPTSGHPYLTPLGLIFWERITSPRGGPFSRVDHPRWDVPPFSQNCRWAPHCVFWWDVPPPQAGPKNLVGHPTSPFCRQDPWHQPKKKIVFLQLFLHCFCPLLVILDALS